jgi:hypothetical protein
METYLWGRRTHRNLEQIVNLDIHKRFDKKDPRVEMTVHLACAGVAQG